MVETKMGYYKGSDIANGLVDIMQCIDPRNLAVQRLAAIGTYDPNEGAKFLPKEGFGLFKKLYDFSGNYVRSNATIDMSVAAGVIWYTHKGGSFESYNGGGDTDYIFKCHELRNILK